MEIHFWSTKSIQLQLLSLNLENSGKGNPRVQSHVQKGQHLQVNFAMIKTLVCFGLVRPLLEHAAMVWDPSTDINIRKIEIVQWQAACSVIRN